LEKRTLPSNWSELPLKDLVVAVKGRKPKTLLQYAQEGRVPYIDISAFEQGTVRQWADVESSQLVTSDQVIVVWDGARCGLSSVGQAGALGSTLAALTVFGVAPRYLDYFLQSNYEYINQQSRGTGIPHVDPEVFGNIQVPLAPFEEQERIVAKLESLHRVKDSINIRLEKIRQSLSEGAKCIFASML